MLVTEEYIDDIAGVRINDVAELLKGTSVLTLQNRVNLNNLTAIRSNWTNTLTARAWDTLRAAVSGVALARAMEPAPDAAGTPDLPAQVVNGLPLMRRGAERC